jgi:hypothetical protein
MRGFTCRLFEDIGEELALISATVIKRKRFQVLMCNFIHCEMGFLAGGRLGLTGSVKDKISYFTADFL